MFSVDADQMETSGTGLGQVELMQYKKIKTYDYTSGKEDKIYALIASNKGEVCKVLFEPNETIVEGFFVKAEK